MICFIYEQKGFRGRRWLIAAIAHVEMITRPTDAELANRITINGSKIEKTGLRSGQSRDQLCGQKPLLQCAGEEIF